MSADLKDLFRTLKISEVLVSGLDDEGSCDNFNVVSEDPSVNGEGGMYADTDRGRSKPFKYKCNEI